MAERKLAPWRHVLLFCKNHYVTKNVPGVDLDALKVVIGHETGIEPEHVVLRDVYGILVGLFLDLAEPWMVRDFMNSLFSWEPTATIEAATGKICGLLACLTCIKGGEVVLDLGAPDPAILPLRSPEKWGHPPNPQEKP